MTLIQQPLQWDPFGRISTIALVGVGGTGSALGVEIGRIIYDMKLRGLDTPHVKFIDPDIVQLSNIGRQRFLEGHVGMPKATVLSRQLNFALGLEIEAISEPFARHHIPSRGVLLCDAVDNHAARRAINEADPICVVSCGNWHNSGQVLVGSEKDLGQVRQAFNNPRNGVVHYFPHPYALYPELLEPPAIKDKEPEALDCGVRVLAGAQSLLINQFMATIAAQYIHKLLYRSTELVSFGAHISGTAITCKPMFATPDTLQSFIDRR